MFRKARHIHFVGIGGIGMSGIAEVLLNLGYKVSGSDLGDSDLTRRLISLGATINLGHDATQIEGADVVVYSSAIKPQNPEVAAARDKFIPVIPRAEMLAELMRLKFSIAVAGTHGKTTTTSLIATILNRAGMDPTAVIGGRLDFLGSNARLGQGEFLVAEADESDGSFLLLTPTIAVITNIDPEHLDHYSGIEHLKKDFLTFVNRVPFYGLAVLCLAHPVVQGLIPEVKKPYVTYGLSQQADFRAEEIEQSGMETSFTVVSAAEGKLGRIRLGMPGQHNVLNTLAAIAVATELDIPFAKVQEALDGFSGIHRRFEPVGQVGRVMVIDDYGHHPVEIKAVLNAAKSGFPEKRIVAVFQPHRFTRTRDLFDDFLTAFNEADSLIVTEIYPASETPIEGVNAKKLYDGIRAFGHKDVAYVPDKDKICDHLLENMNPGDLVITLGAGNINQVGRQLVEELKKRDQE
jgi:UDP-N-acetylmuramate--alanine ligase